LIAFAPDAASQPPATVSRTSRQPGSLDPQSPWPERGDLEKDHPGLSSAT